MHVFINVIVCRIKTTVCNTQRVSLSLYEFLYNNLVIKLQNTVTRMSLVFMQLSVMRAASELIFKAEIYSFCVPLCPMALNHC